nr:pyroglutamyl-peptidase I [Pseudomarimonas arenosa]
MITGFEPFGGAERNPSMHIAEALDGAEIAGQPITSLTLPVVFGESLKRLDQAIRRLRPIGVIALGVATTRSVISIERIAINIDDARIADNAGQQPIDQAIIRHAPAAYFSQLPIKAIHQALQQAGIPSEISQSAGTYVCNHVFFGLMHRLRLQRRIPAGFLHIPPELDVDELHGLPLPRMIEAVRLAITTTLSYAEDIRLSAGRED